MGNIRPVGRIQPVRSFYAAARWHLQKYDLISRIKPNTLYFYVGHLKASRLFLLFTAGAYLRGRALCHAPPLPPPLTLLFSKKEQN